MVCMKRLFSIFLILAVLVAASLNLFASAICAESLYIRKIVSVVYDDSGSMCGNKWAYANYAMQSFCGMLNSEDQLYITYMSRSQVDQNYEPEKIDLSSEGIQDSVDSIRKHKDSGSTPFEAVKKAYDKLKSIDDSNPNTQYWLVVITDGAFNETNKMSADESKYFLNEKFKDYNGQIMPNGTNPQITFLGIGNVVMPDENQNKGIFTYKAQNEDEIINAMSQMSD